MLPTKPADPPDRSHPDNNLTVCIECGWTQESPSSKIFTGCTFNITHEQHQWVADGRNDRERLEHRVELLELALRDARPHVMMSKSVTSGREFQDNAQALLDRIDKLIKR